MLFFWLVFFLTVKKRSLNINLISDLAPRYTFVDGWLRLIIIVGIYFLKKSN